MAKMIEVTACDGKKWLINTAWIEMISDDESGTTIYLAFVLPNAEEQDYIRTKESYEEIKRAIAYGSMVCHIQQTTHNNGAKMDGGNEDGKH